MKNYLIPILLVISFALSAQISDKYLGGEIKGQADIKALYYPLYPKKFIKKIGLILTKTGKKIFTKTQTEASKSVLQT